jgi:hypothetical protein
MHSIRNFGLPARRTQFWLVVSVIALLAVTGSFFRRVRERNRSSAQR